METEKKVDHVKHPVDISTWNLDYLDFSEVINKFIAQTIDEAIKDCGIEFFFPITFKSENNPNNDGIRGGGAKHPLDIYIQLSFGPTDDKSPTYRFNLYDVLADEIRDAREYKSESWSWLGLREISTELKSLAKQIDLAVGGEG